MAARPAHTADNVSLKKRRQSSSSKSSSSKTSGSSVRRSSSGKLKAVRPKSQQLKTEKEPLSKKDLARKQSLAPKATVTSTLAIDKRKDSKTSLGGHTDAPKEDIAKRKGSKTSLGGHTDAPKEKDIVKRKDSKTSLGEHTNATKEDRQSKTWEERLPESEVQKDGEVPPGGGSKTKKTLLLASAAFFIGGAVLTIILWLKFFYTVGYCETQGCLDLVRKLKSTMNKDVNPCYDFYEFTCGSWQPEGNVSSLIERIFARSTDMAIQEMEGESADAAVPKAPEYFKSCVRPREITPTELQTFMRFKQDLGLMWPEKKQVAQNTLFMLLKMSITWGIHMLFNLRAITTYKGRPQTLHIRRGTLKAEWLGNNWSHDTFVTDVGRHCGILGVAAPPGGYDELRQAVEDIVKSALSIPPDATSNTQFKLKEMELLMPGWSQHWLEYLNDLHKPQFMWDLNSAVDLEDDAILVAIDALQKLYTGKTELLLEGFSFVFVRTYLWVLAGKPELLYGADTSLGEHMLKRACLDLTSSNFGLLVAAKHIHERYDVGMRENLNEFYQTIQSQTKEELSEAHWAGSLTRTQAFIKLDELTLDALPDEDFFSKVNLARLYHDFPAISGSFVNNFIDVAAAYRLLIGNDHFIGIYSKRLGGGVPNSYNYYYNIAHLSLAAIEAPILYTDGTLAMKYGSLGTLIAESAVRTFDRRGVAVDEKGRPELWWDTPAYVERASCDLLSGVEPPVAPPDERPGGRDPREVLQSVLFPLAPALTTSFNAYRKAVVTLEEVNKVDQLRLRGMDEVTDDQVFFLTYCLMTCGSKYTGDTCNVPMRHMPQFAAVFSCPEGSAMNPAKKCTFFT